MIENSEVAPSQQVPQHTKNRGARAIRVVVIIGLAAIVAGLGAVGVDRLRLAQGLLPGASNPSYARTSHEQVSQVVNGTRLLKDSESCHADYIDGNRCVRILDVAAEPNEDPATFQARVFDHLRTTGWVEHACFSGRHMFCAKHGGERLRLDARVLDGEGRVLQMNVAPSWVVPPGQ